MAIYHAGRVRPLRVLLVEDDAAVREGIGLALRHQGHDVFVVASGE
jgi:DNA-binding response OmpR family regulator